MTAIRAMPRIGKAQTKESDGCLGQPLLLIVLVAVTYVFVRVMSGDATKLEKNLCVGIAVVFLFLLLVVDAQAREDKQKWRARCLVAWLPVVSRVGYGGSTFEDGYGEIHSSAPS